MNGVNNVIDNILSIYFYICKSEISINTDQENEIDT